MTSWAHASAPRWDERWAPSIKIPRFLAVLGERAYSLRLPWHVLGGPWVWSLGLFSFIFFSTSIKKKVLEQMVGLSVHESGGGGYLVLSRRVARATTTSAHVSAPRWGETWARSIKIPRFLAVLGRRAYSLRPPWHVPGGPWVWSLGLFSSIFFSTSINKKKSLVPTGRPVGTEHNQVGIVHCPVEPFLHFASPQRLLIPQKTRN